MTLAISGFVLAAGEGLLGLTTGSPPLLAAALIVLAPGLALVPHLPRQLSAPATAVAIVPAVSLAAASVAFTSISAVGIPLTPTSVRLTFLAITGASAAVALWRRVGEDRGPAWDPSQEARVLLALGGIVLIAIGLQSRTIGGSPVPGSDWGHYLIYAQEIARRHSLLINNPFWMGGVPFSEDPATPSIYAAWQMLSGVSANLLLHGIWLYAVAGILSMFACLRTLWGDAAALLGTAIYALMPMGQDLLAWHGLATEAALVLLPLVVLCMAQALRGETSTRQSALLALSLVALAATHRLTFTIAVVAVIAAAALGLVSKARWILRFSVTTVWLGAVIGWGVVLGLLRQAARVGATQSYTNYEATRINRLVLDLGLRDLTWPVVAAVLVAGLILLAPTVRMRDRAPLVVTGLLLSLLVFSYLWLVHVPSDYTRPLYYLPVFAALLISAALSALPRPMLRVAASVVAVWAGALAWHDAPALRGFYTFANATSLRGLAQLDRVAPPNAILLTDRCWSFAAMWLLQRPVYAALEPYDNFPARDAVRADQARRLLYAGQVTSGPVARSQYAVVDPLCSAASGILPAPAVGHPIFESTTAVILRLTPRPAR